MKRMGLSYDVDVMTARDVLLYRCRGGDCFVLGFFDWHSLVQDCLKVGSGLVFFFSERGATIPFLFEYLGGDPCHSSNESQQ